MYTDNRDVFWGMIVAMLVFVLFINTGVLDPIFGREEEPEFVPIYKFEDLREAVDSMEYVQNHVDNLTAVIKAKNKHIEELESTEWLVKYELVKGELEKERDSYPSALSFAYVGAYVGGIIGFVLALGIVIIFFHKRNLNLKNRIKELEAKSEDKKPETKEKTDKK